MTDAYIPALSELKFTTDEASAVKAALLTAKPWNEKNDLIKSVKDKIRTHHLTRHGQTCCYCRTILQGGGRFMVDREHILPKGTAAYTQLCYEPWNLSASCKRCNMDIKGEDDDFVVDKADPAKLKTGKNYLLIHPNFDEWELHLSRESQQISRHFLVKYSVIDESDKGQYSYNYFRLKELEVNSLDAAQGLKPITQNESDAVQEARAIAAAFGQ